MGFEFQRSNMHVNLSPYFMERVGGTEGTALSQETANNYFPIFVLIPSLVTNGARAGHLFCTMATSELAFCDWR